MKDNEKKKRPYVSPRIMTYILGTTDPDFLTASGEDPDQGEWDAQPDYFIPNRFFVPEEP